MRGILETMVCRILMFIYHASDAIAIPNTRCYVPYMYIYICIYRHMWSPHPTTRTPLKKNCKYRYKRRFFPNPILELFSQIGNASVEHKKIQKSKLPKTQKSKNPKLQNVLHLRNLAIVFGFLDFWIFWTFGFLDFWIFGFLDF